MTLDKVLQRDQLKREIVLAYQAGNMTRAQAMDGLRRLGSSQDWITSILDAAEKVRA